MLVHTYNSEYETNVRTDVMMFANAAVAFTCIAFCWVMAVVGFKGWLKSRTQGAMQFHSSA